MPEGYLKRPLLEESLELSWDAFWALSSDRAIGFGGEGPIPFSAIDRYAQRYGVDDLEAFDLLRGQIQALDGEYLKIRARKRDDDAAKGKKEKPI